MQVNCAADNCVSDRNTPFAGQNLEFDRGEDDCSRGHCDRAVNARYLRAEQAEINQIARDECQVSVPWMQKLEHYLLGSTRVDSVADCFGNLLFHLDDLVYGAGATRHVCILARNHQPVVLSRPLIVNVCNFEAADTEQLKLTPLHVCRA